MADSRSTPPEAFTSGLEAPTGEHPPKPPAQPGSDPPHAPASAFETNPRAPLQPRSEPGVLLAAAAESGPAILRTAPRESAHAPPVSPLDRVTTARLLPARYSDSVLTRIADSEDDLQAIYALDNATNARLQAEANGQPEIAARELVRHGRYARIINAAFTHPHPLGARFSTPYRGAWYAGFELATAKAEVLFHRSVQLTEIGWTQPEALEYDHYSAEFSGLFHDLRLPAAGAEAEAARTACLDPASYVASQALAIRLLQQGSPGIVYPSARRPAGTCFACFQPSAVTRVHKHDMHRLTWYPDAPAVFTRVPRT